MRILLIEKYGDLLDQAIGDIRKSYIVDITDSGTEGTYLSAINQYDAVVVGDTLADMNSYEVCRKIKQESRKNNTYTPIVYIPENNNVSNRLAAFESGADVCINRPLNMLELKAQLKVFEKFWAKTKSSIIKIGCVTLDFTTRSVLVKGKNITLRRKEFDILEYLFINKNTIISKEEILEHVWENGIYVFSNTLEVHILNIRNRLEKPNKVSLIKTARGFGYYVGGLRKKSKTHMIQR